MAINVPHINVPSLSVPTVYVPKIQPVHISAPGKGNYFKQKTQHVKDIGDILLGNPITGTRELRETLQDNGFEEIVYIPIINRVVGLGIMANERLISPLLKGNVGEATINTLESIGYSYDTFANPIKSLMPWAGGGSGDDFLKSMGWIDGEYRENYEWNVDTGNGVLDFVINLAGELASDPLNYPSFGMNQVAKTGLDLTADALRKGLANLKKLSNISDDVVQTTLHSLRKINTNKDTLDDFYDTLINRRDELSRLLSTTPPRSNEVKQLKDIIKQYDVMLDPKLREQVNQVVSDARFSKHYERYRTITKYTNAVKRLEDGLTTTTSIFIPTFGVTRLVASRLVIPGFKALYTNTVTKLKDLDLKHSMNNLPGTIEGVTRSIYTTNRSINKKVYESFDEVLAPYNIDTDKLIKAYTNILKNLPEEHLSIKYADRLFFDELAKAIPDLKYIKRSTKVGKQMRKWLNSLRPDLIDGKTIQDYIESIRSVALTVVWSEEVLKQVYKETNIEHAQLIKQLDNMQLKEKLQYIIDNMYIYGKHYELEDLETYLKDLEAIQNKDIANGFVKDNLKEHIKELRKEIVARKKLNLDTTELENNYKLLQNTYISLKNNPEKLILDMDKSIFKTPGDVRLLLSYLGVDKHNYIQVATLLKAGDEKAMRELADLLVSTKKKAVLDFKHTKKGIKNLSSALSASSAQYIPSGFDDNKVKDILGFMSSTEAKAVKEIIPKINIDDVESAYSVFMKSLSDLLEGIDYSDLDDMFRYYDSDTKNTAYIKRLFNKKFNFNNLKDVELFKEYLNELRTKSYLWMEQLKDGNISKLVSPETKSLIYNLNGLVRSATTVKLVKQTDKLAATGKTYYMLTATAAQRYKIILDTLHTLDYYDAISTLDSTFRANMREVMFNLAEVDSVNARHAVKDIRNILTSVDSMNAAAMLFDRRYAATDLPQEVNNFIYSMLFNTLYNNSRVYSFRITNDVIDKYTSDIMSQIRNYNTQRLYRHFSENPGIVVKDMSELDELTKLERKLQEEGLDNVEQLRFEELKETLFDVDSSVLDVDKQVQQCFLDIEANIKEALNAYVDILHTLSGIHNQEFPFFRMLSDDAIKSMTDLGDSYADIVKAMAEKQVSLEAQDEMLTFIERVSGTTYTIDNETLVERVMKYVDNLEQIPTEEIEKELTRLREESMGRLLTRTFTNIDQVNAYLAGADGNLGRNLNKKKVKNIVQMVADTEFNHYLQDTCSFVNAYDMSNSIGSLAVKKVIEPELVEKLQLAPELFKAKDVEYTMLYENLQIARRRVDKRLALNEEYAEHIREALISTFRTAINWGPIDVVDYFESLSIENVYAWHTMMSTYCFGKRASRRYNKMFNKPNIVPIQDLSYNEKADYYSNPMSIYKDLDTLAEQPMTKDDAYNDIVANVTKETVDELFLGVTSDLNRFVKDKDTLLNYEDIYKTQIQEQTKAVNRLRSLDSLVYDDSIVADIVDANDDEAWEYLKQYGIYQHTPVASENVAKYLYRERATALSESVKSWNAKQIRSFIDDNTDGMFYWVFDYKNNNPLKFSKADLAEAGLRIENLNDNIQLIIRTSTEHTHTPYSYLGYKSYFKRQQAMITRVLKQNRNHVFWDGMTIPDELWTGNMVSKNTWETLKTHSKIKRKLGDITKQKTYSKMDAEGLNSFYTTEVSRPSAVFLGLPDAQHIVISEFQDVFANNKVTPAFDSTNILKSVWSGSISAIKRENKVTKYLQLWLNDDFSIDNPMFHDVLDNLDNEGLKEIFGSNRYTAVIVKQDRKGRPKVYRIHVENQKQLEAARKARAIVVPREIYRNMVLSVNHHKLDNPAMRIFNGIVAATYKTVYLNTPGYFVRNFLDSAVFKNASSTGGIADIPVNMKYQIKAARTLDWFNKVQGEMLRNGNDFNAAIKSFNRQAIRAGLKDKPEELIRTYALVDLYIRSSASSGLSRNLESYLMERSLTNNKFVGYNWERYYQEVVLGNPVMQVIPRINDLIEQSSRYALFLRVLEETGDAGKAIREVVGTHFDYAIKGGGLEIIDDIFWFSTFPINNIMYYLNEGLTKNPNMFRMQMDALELSWNDDELSWEDVKESDYLTYNAATGNIRFDMEGKDIVLKTGSSVLDFLNILINPFGEALERLNPFLSVGLGLEKPSQLNPFVAMPNKIEQIKTGNSYMPSLYTRLYERKEYPKRKYQSFDYGSSWNPKPRKTYIKDSNMKVMLYKFATDRYYFGRGKNKHRWLKSTNSIEPYWYMNNWRYRNAGRSYRKKITAPQQKRDTI